MTPQQTHHIDYFISTSSMHADEVRMAALFLSRLPSFVVLSTMFQILVLPIISIRLSITLTPRLPHQLIQSLDRRFSGWSLIIRDSGENESSEIVTGKERKRCRPAGNLFITCVHPICACRPHF
jgi:hypothetical protein